MSYIANLRSKKAQYKRELKNHRALEQLTKKPAQAQKDDPKRTQMAKAANISQNPVRKASKE